MGLFDKLFRSGSSASEDVPQLTIPSHRTAQEFGKVVVRPIGVEVEVEVSLAMEPQGRNAEGWQTGVALDASSSMKDWYGRLLIGEIPKSVQVQYEKNGWLENRVEDGRKLIAFQKEAYEDAIKQGYLKFSDNIVEPVARNFISYLASNLDADGGTTTIYWACGNSEEIEVIGDFTEQECHQMVIAGPTTKAFGQGTKLKPAVQYFVDRFHESKRGMYIFITDGKIDDLTEVKKYTTELARKIEGGANNEVKCVLIGVGDKIDRKQLTELDDLETGTSVDIWDYKIAEEMRSLIEIFAEVVEENQIVAPFATLLDAQGMTIKKYTDGLPAKIKFTMSSSSDSFQLEVAGRTIRQNIAVF